MVYFRYISVYYQFTQSYVDTLFYLFNYKVHGDYIQKIHETNTYKVFEQRFLKQSSGNSIYTHTFKTLFPTLDFNINTTFDCTELLSKSQCILNVSVQTLQFSNTSHNVLSLDYTRQFREFASHIVLEPSLTFTHLDLIKEYLGLTSDCTISIVTSDLDLVVLKPQSLESNMCSILNEEQNKKQKLLEQETKVCIKLKDIDDISIKQIDVSDSYTPQPQQISPSNSSSSSFSMSKSKNLKKTKKKKLNFISFWWDN
jgi:hypothetical protein